MLKIQRNKRVNTRVPRKPKRACAFDTCLIGLDLGHNSARRMTARTWSHSVNRRDYPSRNCPVETQHALYIYNRARELYCRRIIGGAV